MAEFSTNSLEESAVVAARGYLPFSVNYMLHKENGSPNGEINSNES
jgi:hypothetical protein